MTVRRILALVLAASLALPLALAGPATAQADLGNDGVDRDCADFFELNAAQAYFDTDGGSAARNVDNLDPTRDGLACRAEDQAIEDTGDGDGGVTLDADADGLMDEEELQLGTDPNDADSDNDRLSDGFEVREFGTNALAADTDEDGLGDGDELEVFGTDALAADTDGDGVDDATELDAGTDPADPASFPGAAPAPEPTAPPAPSQPTPAPEADEAGEVPEVGDTLTAAIEDADGKEVAVALLAESAEEDEDGTITVGVVAVGLAPGAHGIHIYETGVCDPDGGRPFASAGGHYDPAGAEHGQHAGDLGNIVAEEDGTATFLETTTEFDLEELQDEDGAAIVIHAEEDENDPEGESFGEPIACGVLAPPADEETPEADDEAEETPAG